jgi:uncharacterized protein YciI
MTHFLLEYRYADQDARAKARREHLAYMTALNEAGTVVLAGPLGDGGGGVVVLDVEDEAAARVVVDGDPYTSVGATTGHLLREWNVVIPAQG